MQDLVLDELGLKHLRALLLRIDRDSRGFKVMVKVAAAKAGIVDTSLVDDLFEVVSARCRYADGKLINATEAATGSIFALMAIIGLAQGIEDTSGRTELGNSHNAHLSIAITACRQWYIGQQS